MKKKREKAVFALRNIEGVSCVEDNIYSSEDKVVFCWCTSAKTKKAKR